MNWRSLKVQVTLGALVFLVAGLWSLAFFANRTLRDTLRQRLAEQQRATVAVLASHVDTVLKLRMAVLRAVAGPLGAGATTRPAALQPYLDARPELEELFNGGLDIVGTDGAMLASEPRDAGRAGENTQVRERVRATLAQGVEGVSSPYRGQPTKAPTFDIAVPIKDSRGRVVAALVGIVDLGQSNFLGQTAGEVLGGPLTTFCLVDPATRMIVTSSDRSRILTPFPGPGRIPAIDRIVAGYEGSSVYVDPLGVEQFASSTRIRSTGWIAHLTVPSSVAFAQIAQLERRVFLAAIALTVAMGLATWALLRRRLAPLAEAARSISGLSQGDTPLAPLPVPKTPEIGQLIGSFNRLVTTLTRRDAALRESEERYRVAFETSPDAVIITRLADGLILKVSAGFERMTGWSDREVVGRTTGELGIWRDAAQRQHLAEAVVRDGYCAGLEAQFARKDGSTLTALVSAHRIEVDGQPCLLSISRDITDRKAAEGSLQRLSHLYAALGQCNQAIVRSHSEAELFEQVCRIVVDVAGMKMAWIGLADPEARVVKAVAWHGQGTDYVSRLRISLDPHEETSLGPSGTAIRDNTPVWTRDFMNDPRTRPWHEAARPYGWRASASLPLCRGGSPAGVLTIYAWEPDAFDQDMKELVERMATDISFALDTASAEQARKAAEEQLRKLSLAVDQSLAGIMITDTTGRIEYVNEAFARMKDYQPGALVGQNIRMLRSPSAGTSPYAAMWDNLARGLPWKGESMRQRKDGSEFPAFSIVTPLRRADGVVTHYVTVTEDVSEDRRLARELDQHRHHLEELVETRTSELREARRQAESANLAKSRFLANMSHEIRTPMNAIVGLAYMLRRDGVTPQQEARLQQIEGSGQHLLSVLNDILDLSKIEAGRMELERADFHLPGLLDEVVALVRPQAEAKGLRLECDCDALPAWLHGDPTRLRQVLINYLGNAVKFTERGFVALRCRLVQERGDAVQVRFDVTDTGIGVADDKLETLFRPFEQADASTSRNFGGTGLGLAINSHLARMMDGEVGVRSTPGQGSTFWFTAWLQRSQRTAAPTEAPSALDALDQLRRRRPGARVLLVEDNAISAEVAADLLRDAGLAVDLARDGVEAVAKASLASYDLVLMDMQMPRMDGLQATRAIRALPGWKDRPIIALTANVLAGDRRQCLDAGMNDFLGKPLKPDSLYLLLWRCLGLEAPSRHGDSVPAPAPAPADAQADLERVADSPDMNREQVLSFRHRAAKYLDLLRSLVSRHADDMAQVATHLEAGDAAEARRLAHALRGDAAVLGAARLMHRAGDLEALLRQDADAPDDEEVRLAIQEVREALAGIAATLGLPIPGAALRRT